MYSLIATVSVFVATFLAEYIAKHEKLKLKNNIWEIILMVMLFGVIGARLYHTIDYFEYYKTDPIQILNFRAGGLAIYGGLIGGFIGAIISSKVYAFSLYKFLDLVSIVLPLGQSIGRWGNFFNFELYGKPYNGILKLYIPNFARQSGFENTSYYHPLFLYESVLNLLLFFIIFAFWKKEKVKIGSLNFLYSYVLGYGLIRYTLEPLRINAWVFNNLNVAQLISFILICIGCFGLLSNKILLLKNKK